MSEINRDNLFTSRPYGIDQQEGHPSAEITEYVLGRLPRDLAAIRAGDLTYDELSDKHRSLIANLDYDSAQKNDREAAAVLQLDLGFMMGSYLPDDNFSHCPNEILELAKLQSQRFGLFPYMDYELIIDVNSREFERTGQMRTFLDGDLGLAERDFYYGHHLSEPHIKDVAFRIDEIVMNRQSDDLDVDAGLATAAESMGEFKDYMAKYAKLSKDAFSSFRPYLGSYPDGTRNASGAFMPSVQLAEVRLQKPSDEHLVFLAESMPYFPAWSRELIAQWTQESLEGNNLMDRIERGEILISEERKETLSLIVEDFYRFRAMHNAITKKQISEAFEGRNMPIGRRQAVEFGEPDILADGEKGTAGFDIVNILGGAASRMARLGDKIKDIDNTAS